LGNTRTAQVRHPDVGSVKDHSKRVPSHIERAQNRAVAGSHLTYSAGLAIAYPETVSIEAKAHNNRAYGVLSKHRTIDGTDFDQCVESVERPEIVAIEP